MTGNAETNKNTRLRAFIGRSFNNDDINVWREFREIFDGFNALGVAYEDGKDFETRPISDKVKERIGKSNIYVGILTRRHPIWDLSDTSFLSRFKQFKPKKWATSEWIIEEVGFALGKGKKVITLIEEGVIFPVSDLDADTQWISFSRDNISSCLIEMTEMITSLVATTIPASSPADAEVKPSEEQQNNSEQEQLTEQPLIITFIEHLKAKEFAEAEGIEKKVLDEIKDENEKNNSKKSLTVLKARAGHEKSIDELIQTVQKQPKNKLLNCINN